MAKITITEDISNAKTWTSTNIIMNISPSIQTETCLILKSFVYWSINSLAFFTKCYVAYIKLYIQFFWLFNTLCAAGFLSNHETWRKCFKIHWKYIIPCKFKVEILYKTRLGKTEATSGCWFLGDLGGERLLRGELLLVLPHQLPSLLHLLHLQFPLSLLLGFQLSKYSDS